MVFADDNGSANDSAPYRLSDSHYGELPHNAVQYIEIKNLLFTDSQIINDRNITWHSLSKDFKPNNQSTYWFKTRLKASQESHWLLTPGQWQKSTVYHSTDELNWKATNTSVFTPLSEREFKSHLPMVRLNIPAKGITVIVKAKGFRHGREPIAQKIQLFSKEAYLANYADEERVQGGYMGFSIALAGFHFILWLWFRERTYLWLVAAMLASPVFYHSLLGFGFTRLWPEWPTWNEYASSILAALVPALYLRFGASYLNLISNMPRLNQAITGLFYAIILSSVAVFVESVNLLWIQALLTAIGSFFLLGSSIVLAVRGYKYAWYFVVGNLMVLVSLFIWPYLEISNMSWDELPFSIVNFSQFSSAWLGILLALGMVERMQNMRQILLKKELDSERQAVKFAQQTRALIQAQNEELESSNKALKELDDLKDEFLARTSHELNTPLNGIIGLSQILLDEEVKVTEKERQEYLELIASRSEHLKELVSELLEFVKTRKEVINLYREKIDITSHLEKLTLTFITQAENKGIVLNFKKNIPIITYADPRRIRQVFAILIDNAIKYTDRGEVNVSVQSEKVATRITISDTGIGIDDEHLEIIFEPFKQLKQGGKTRDGAGLGLSICKHLIELHGGTLEIESKVGKGSRFTIILPNNPQ